MSFHGQLPPFTDETLLKRTPARSASQRHAEAVLELGEPNRDLAALQREELRMEGHEMMVQNRSGGVLLIKFLDFER